MLLASEHEIDNWWVTQLPYFAQHRAMLMYTWDVQEGGSGSGLLEWGYEPGGVVEWRVFTSAIAHPRPYILPPKSRASASSSSSAYCASRRMIASASAASRPASSRS